MADKKKGRKFRKYIRGPILIDLNLATLAAVTLLGVNVTDSVQEKAWLSSVVLRWDLEGMLASADSGPVLCGIAHSDYSDAEIEAWVEQATGWAEGDLVSREIGSRKIRQVGTFLVPSATAGNIQVLNDGKPVRTKCGWMLMTGQTVRVWAYNLGQAALTGSPALHSVGHANIWPA